MLINFLFFANESLKKRFDLPQETLPAEVAVKRAGKRDLTLGFCLLAAVLFICQLCVFSNAATYYVDPVSGSDSSGRPGDISRPYRRLETVSSLLHAGDTVLLREGHYSEDVFAPARSGASGNPITVEAFPGETPVFSGDGDYGVVFNTGLGLSHFVIRGVHFQDTLGHAIYIHDQSSDVLIENCRFEHHHNGNQIYLVRASEVIIRDCYFDEVGSPSNYGSGENIFVKGSDHVLIENNYFARAGHYAITVEHYLSYTEPSYAVVIRNNLIEQHWGGGISIGLHSRDCIVEGNRVYYAGEQVLSYPKTGIQIRSNRNIVRRNIVAFTCAAPEKNFGMTIQAYDYHGMRQDCRNNRIYNNVIYKSGNAGLFFGQKHSAVLEGNKLLNNIVYHNHVGGPDRYFGMNNIIFETYHSYSDNKWSKFANGNVLRGNLLLHAGSEGDYPGYDPFVFYDGDGIWDKTLTEVENEYPDVFMDNVEFSPEFIAPDQRNFELRAESPAVDAGVFLTQTRSADSNTTRVPVQDAFFFTDGFGLVPGDLVRVGGGNASRVILVDIESHDLILDRPVSFASGAGVSVNYSGSAPDLGALEHGFDYQTEDQHYDSQVTSVEQWNSYR